MRKIIIIILLALLTLTGCGNKKDLSEISCKYSQSEDDMGVVVEMRFKRDNKKNLVTSGELIMSYNLAGIDLGSYEGEELTKDNVDGLITGLFSSVCDNTGDNYTDCKVVETEKGADIVMSFNLDNLAKTSEGQFHKNMNIQQIKSYILKRSTDSNMVCTTK